MPALKDEKVPWQLVSERRLIVLRRLKRVWGKDSEPLESHEELPQLGKGDIDHLNTVRWVRDSGHVVDYNSHPGGSVNEQDSSGNCNDSLYGSWDGG